MLATVGRARSVVMYPSRVLKMVTQPVQFGGVKGDTLPPQLAQLASDLVATVKAENGLGVAAPQVGPVRDTIL